MSWFRSEKPSVGSVLYRGTMVPRAEEFGFLTKLGIQVKPAPAKSDVHWALRLSHSAWGTADMICLKNTPPVREALEFTRSLTEAELRDAHAAGCGVALRVPANQKTVLRDRKNMLRYMRAIMAHDAVAAVDHASMLVWSRTMLDDEVAHDAELDVESIYSIHAVGDDSGNKAKWVHTHGLAVLGAFDVDFVRPQKLYELGGFDAIRSLAFAVLEKEVAPTTPEFELGHPGGSIRLVTAADYQSSASAEDREPREMDDDSHQKDRSVVCEPVRGILGKLRSRPRPSRFFEETMREGCVFRFSGTATDLMSERARGTIDVARVVADEFREFEFTALVKLGYPTDGGEGGGREHLWFEVHEFGDDSIDATLVNDPYYISSLKKGQRARHDLDLLTDWVIPTPAGSATPRDMSPIRRVREKKEELRMVMRSERGRS